MKEVATMDDGVPTVLRRESEVVRRASPLIDGARVVRSRVIEELGAIDDELHQLRAQAETELEEARAKVEEIRENARTEGREEGLRECMENLAAARSEYAEVRKRAERDMVDLAFHVAQRIIGHCIEVKPQVVRDIVGEALVGARGREQILVRLHPDDHKEVEVARDDYARELDGVAVYFEADTSLERGGCIIETESGRIDARLETQLEVLREAVKG